MSVPLRFWRWFSRRIQIMPQSLGRYVDIARVLSSLIYRRSMSFSFSKRALLYIVPENHSCFSGRMWLGLLSAVHYLSLIEEFSFAGLDPIAPGRLLFLASNERVATNSCKHWKVLVGQRHDIEDRDLRSKLQFPRNLRFSSCLLYVNLERLRLKIVSLK